MRLTSVLSAAILAFVPTARAEWPEGPDDVVVNNQPDENCAQGPYTNVVGTGAETGRSYCAGRWRDGFLPKALEIHAIEQNINLIKIIYTDGERQIVGWDWGETTEESGTKWGQIEWNPLKERFRSVKLWRGGLNGEEDDVLSKIEIEIEPIDPEDGGETKKLTVESEEWEGSESYDLDIGKGGVLLGLRGKCYSAIDKLEFIFTNDEIDEVIVEDIDIDPSLEELNEGANNEDRGFELTSLEVLHQANYLPDETTLWITGDSQVEISTEVSVSHSDTFHTGVGVSVKFPLGPPIPSGPEMSVNYEMFWENTETETKTEGEKRTDSRGWKGVATTRSCAAVRCTAWTRKGVLEEISWTGKTKIIFKGGEQLAYKTEGKFGTTTFSKSFLDCHPETLEDYELALIGGEDTILEDGEPTDNPQHDPSMADECRAMISSIAPSATTAPASLSATANSTFVTSVVATTEAEESPDPSLPAITDPFFDIERS